MESFQEPRARTAQPGEWWAAMELVYALGDDCVAVYAPRARPSGNSNSSSDAGVHLDAEAGRGRRQVAAAAHAHRVDEVLVQVVGELDRAVLQAAADADVVDQRDVLPVLAQAEAAGVRADRHAELRREQQHRQRFVEAAEPAVVELAEVDRLAPARAA